MTNELLGFILWTPQEIALRLRTIPLLLLAVGPHAFGQSSDRNYVAHEHYTGAAAKVRTVSYYDGLGRQESTARNTGEGTAFLHTGTEYVTSRLVGRESLPAKGSTEPTYMSFDAMVSPSNTYQLYGSDPYTFTSHEHDALDRPTTSVGPGKNWRTAGKGIRRSYGYCEAGEVHDFSKGWLTYSGFWAKGALSVETVTDEDGHTVMERRGAHSDTYYVYNAVGQLVFVLPPAIAETLGTSGTVPDDLIARYAYQYSYDSAGHPTGKTLPGWKSAERQVLDHAHRPVFTQTPSMRTKGLWAFTLYDPLGRVAVQGTTTDGKAVTNYKGDIVTATYTGSGAYDGWESNLHLGSWQALVTNYYDDYAFLSRLGMDRYALAYARYDGYPATPHTAKGRPTGSIVRHGDGMVGAEGDLRSLASVCYYDRKGNVIQQRSRNILGGLDVTMTQYDGYTDLPLRSAHRHSASGRDMVVERYEYDYDGAARLREVRHAVGDATPTAMVAYEYDPLGRVKMKTLAGKETVSYDYDIRGKTKRILSTHFWETLAYEGISDGLTPQTPLYAGGIAAMRWRAGDRTLRGYQLEYDELDRLTAAHYGEGLVCRQNQGRFDEELVYDGMGNVTALQRSGLLDDGSYGLVDNLTLSYDGNQLTSIDDAVEGPYMKDAFHYRDGWDGDGQVEFLYDDGGNLTSDRDKGVAIGYNVQGMPVRITHGDGGSETNTYDFAGRRLKTVYAVNPLTGMQPQTAVMDGGVPEGMLQKDSVVYCGNVVYDRGEVRLLTDEGYVTLDDGKPVYHYYLRDHLGSVRVVMNGDGNTVEQVNHYYPFGGLMPMGTGACTQPLKFNGKELERTNGLDLADYGARWYNPAAPAWLTIDPLAEK